MLIALNNFLIGRTDQVCRIGVNVEMLTLSAVISVGIAVPCLTCLPSGLRPKESAECTHPNVSRFVWREV